MYIKQKKQLHIRISNLIANLQLRPLILAIEIQNFTLPLPFLLQFSIVLLKALYFEFNSVVLFKSKAKKAPLRKPERGLILSNLSLSLFFHKSGGLNTQSVV